MLTTTITRLRPRNQGFGFVTFENEELVDKLVQEHFVHIDGKKVRKGV